MASYLVVDVDDLLGALQSRSFSVDLHDLATRLRGNAAMAAGLFSPDALKAIAVADWAQARATSNISAEQIFQSVGFETFNVPDRRHITDALIIAYFSFDPEPVDELIIVTTS